MIAERLNSLRALMQRKGVGAYYVPTADFHLSEYVNPYFKSRQYLTGFTGSAGTLIVTMTEAALWVDGRYFIQAEEQIKGTPVKLMKMGEEGVPTTMEYLASLPARRHRYRYGRAHGIRRNGNAHGKDACRKEHDH